MGTTGGVAPIFLFFTLFILAECPCVHAQTGIRTESQQHSTSTRGAADLFRLLSPSVFVVEALDADGSVVALGSGVAVGPEEIVTNTHVIDPGISIRVRQGSKTWSAVIEHISLDADLCRLRVDALNALPVTIRQSKTLSAGEQVYAIGAPEGLELTISGGLTSGIRELDGEEVIQTSTPISHGSSGGGLFDGEGNLIGITTFMLVTGQNLNFALPVDSINEPASSHDIDVIPRHFGTGFSYDEAVRIFGKDEVDKDLEDIRLSEQALTNDPNNSHAHAILGDRLLTVGDPHRAVRELTESQTLGREGLDFDLGLALRRIGDAYGAVREFRQSVQHNPNEPAAHDLLMDALMEDEASPTEVLREAQTTAHLDPSHTVEFPSVAKWMVQNGDKNSALAVCQEILDAEIGGGFQSMGHTCRGMVQWLAEPRDPDASTAEFHGAAQLAPKDRYCHHDLAIILELTGKFDEAVNEFKTAADLDPTSQEFQTDYEAALKYLHSRAPTVDNKAPSFGEFLEQRQFREDLQQRLGEGLPLMNRAL